VNSSVKISSDFPSALLIELPFPGQLDVVNALLDGFQNQVRIPAHSWFVLDTSGSMGGNGGIEQLKSALAGLGGDDSSVSGRLTHFLNRERIEIVTFSDRARPVRRFAMGDTPSDNEATRRQIVNFAQQLQAGGGTAIYDAVTAAYQDALAARPGDGDRYYQTLVLMTDGQNTRGRDFSEFAAWYHNLPTDQRALRIFPVAFGEADMEELKRLADLTGGKAFDGRIGDLRQMFKEIRGYQ
jgi:Ca-activated chloride channel family protein